MMLLVARMSNVEPKLHHLCSIPDSKAMIYIAALKVLVPRYIQLEERTFSHFVSGRHLIAEYNCMRESFTLLVPLERSDITRTNSTSTLILLSAISSHRELKLLNVSVEISNLFQTCNAVFFSPKMRIPYCSL